jgi:hypothetical protein|tara:strand:- start:8115 stop:8381 length:267 start_codon:yes stop_codon:yes gene_type:complete
MFKISEDCVNAVSDKISVEIKMAEGMELSKNIEQILQENSHFIESILELSDILFEDNRDKSKATMIGIVAYRIMKSAYEAKELEDMFE